MIKIRSILPIMLVMPSSLSRFAAGLAGFGVFVSGWLVYLIAVQQDLSPAAKPADLVFLVSVGGVIGALMIHRNQHLDSEGRLRPVERRHIGIAAASGAGLLVLGTVLIGLLIPNADAHAIHPAVSAVAFVGTALAGLLARPAQQRAKELS